MAKDLCGSQTAQSRRLIVEHLVERIRELNRVQKSAVSFHRAEPAPISRRPIPPAYTWNFPVSSPVISSGSPACGVVLGARLCSPFVPQPPSRLCLRIRITARQALLYPVSKTELRSDARICRFLVCRVHYLLLYLSSLCPLVSTTAVGYSSTPSGKCSLGTRTIC